MNKKSRKIKRIIYENTVYQNGKNRIYPTITELNTILDEIIDAKATTEYLRITPFYVNEKKNRQFEFDEYMLYLECKKIVDSQIWENHILDCLGLRNKPVSKKQNDLGKILYPLCEYSDIEKFESSIEAYRGFLEEILPNLLEYAKQEMELSFSDLGFGYFCFEIHCE